MVINDEDLPHEPAVWVEYLDLLEACVGLSTDAEEAAWLPRLARLLLEERRRPEEQLADWLKNEV